MTRAAPFLALLLLVPAAFAKEEGGTDCGLFAILRGDDPGERKIYDGIRKGLELARLPRVCLEEIDPWPEGLGPFVEGLANADDARRAAGPVFGIGDEVAERLLPLKTSIPRVFVLQRYSVEREPLRELPPIVPRSAVVYADVGAERLGRVIHGLFGRTGVRAWFTWAHGGPERGEDLARFREAAGLAPPDAQPPRHPEVLLHLRLGLHYGLVKYAEVVQQARQYGIPMISDDRGRFGQGAVVTLVPTQDLVGRAAAEAGRRLRADPEAELGPRAITAVEVWVDLHAADEQGIELPLPFVAKADKLKRSRVPR